MAVGQEFAGTLPRGNALGTETSVLRPELFKLTRANVLSATALGRALVFGLPGGIGTAGLIAGVVRLDAAIDNIIETPTQLLCCFVLTAARSEDDQ